MRLRTKHLLIALLVFVAEILVGTVFADVRFIRSFLSDFLVVILLYHLIKGFRDDKPLTVAVVVFVFACFVEGTQYFPLSDALGLHRSSLLSILMGTSFSWIDIIMYFLGCCTSYIVDSRILSVTKHNTKPAASALQQIKVEEEKSTPSVVQEPCKSSTRSG